MLISTSNNKEVFQSDLELLIILVAGKKLPALPLAKNSLLLAELQRHAILEDLQQNNLVVFYPAKENGLKIPKQIALVKNNIDGLAGLLTKVKTIGIFLSPDTKDTFTQEAVLKIAGSWYSPKQNKEQKKLILFSAKKIERQLKEAEVLAESINTVKQLSNTPANLMTPSHLETEAKTLAKKFGLKFHSLGEAEMQKMSMGGILGVSQGSDEEAKLIVVEYNSKAKKTIGLVGKGITFDSGGISLKHSKSLADMKHDMTGGACVLALLTAAARLKLPYHVVGIIAATENLPSGKALKPGDVITTHSGKTIEVLNTDAEGRLVLADALTYLQKKYKPKLIIDLATLTSGIIVSLGSDITGAFGNNTKINQQLLAAAKNSGESFHFMPLHEKYRKELTSKLADLKNIGKQRSDAIFAALFLQEFIENKTPWLHLDIAGTSWDNNGATGATVSTLIKLLEKLKI